MYIKGVLLMISSTSNNTFAVLQSDLKKEQVISKNKGGAHAPRVLL